ncbi:ryl-alcohol dehydrogenase [Diaporthe amygdali]|uniref:ryl-alcohol dehydrogenase n=1 Tax=Phomopsis amygdali TaxID=1214568 RepID=UPI0022FE2980|nr:ryl-alcohol dehydrogenase [Diaporthe amygdali]KAJ0117533.1 ryl-alcohol dehydrogenase [Diaporthe amygdali]
MANLSPLPLPHGIVQRYIDLTGIATCGLKIFILEAGDPKDPLILLFHGYPELAYTWRKAILPLSAKGYHVVAPDSRGYGRTTGWDTSSYAHTNLSQFTPVQLILDNIALMRGLGHDTAACVVGHDFGATAASVCALSRPDLFKAAVFMGHVPPGPITLPPMESSTSGEGERSLPRDPDVHTSLAQRNPPLKHYQWYNSTSSAAYDWENPQQGLPAFLRGYVHLKSHVWKGHGDIGRLTGWTADQLTRMPEYYIMPLGSTMPDIVEQNMRAEDVSLTRKFMSDEELDVYVSEFKRTGFQGMLNWYRSSTDPRNAGSAMAVFAGQKFEVPTTYISGTADWGNYQRPGALEGFETGKTASDYRGTRIFEGAGHWPQTEIPEIVCEEVVKFLGGH